MIAGSEGLPDAIQKCDSTSKQLQKNQSNIVTQLSNFKAQLDNFTEQVIQIQIILFVLFLVNSLYFPNF